MPDNIFTTDIGEIPDSLLPTKDDLSGDMETVAEIVGIRNTLRLAQVFQGTYVYFRNFNEVRRKIRDKEIRAESDQGKSAATLARKFHLSERNIWKILSEPDD